MIRMALATGAIACATVVMSSADTRAQAIWVQESFPAQGFSVKVPPGWQVLARPTAGDATFKISKEVSPDLFDVCLVHVHNRPSNGKTQEQIDEFQKKKFLGSPVPDAQAIESEKRRLEDTLSREGPPVKIEALSLDKLSGHPSMFYTYTRERVGNKGDLKQFAYVNTLETPERAFTLLCQATSHDIDAARMEFGQKIYKEIVPFIGSFALE